MLNILGEKPVETHHEEPAQKSKEEVAPPKKEAPPPKKEEPAPEVKKEAPQPEVKLDVKHEAPAPAKEEHPSEGENPSQEGHQEKSEPEKYRLSKDPGCANDVQKLCPNVKKDNNFAVFVCLQEHAEVGILLQILKHMI